MNHRLFALLEIFLVEYLLVGSFQVVGSCQEAGNFQVVESRLEVGSFLEAENCLEAEIG